MKKLENGQLQGRLSKFAAGGKILAQSVGGVLTKRVTWMVLGLAAGGTLLLADTAFNPTLPEKLPQQERSCKVGSANMGDPWTLIDLYSINGHPTQDFVSAIQDCDEPHGARHSGAGSERHASGAGQNWDTKNSVWFNSPWLEANIPYKEWQSNAPESEADLGDGKWRVSLFKGLEGDWDGDSPLACDLGPFGLGSGYSPRDLQRGRTGRDGSGIQYASPKVNDTVPGQYGWVPERTGVGAGGGFGGGAGGGGIGSDPLDELVVNNLPRNYYPTNFGDGGGLVPGDTPPTPEVPLPGSAAILFSGVVAVSLRRLVRKNSL